MIKSFFKNTPRIIIAAAFAVMVFFSNVSVTYADVLSDRISDVTASTNETTFVQSIVRLSIPIAILSLVGLSAYAGFLMLTSQGNPEKLAEAKEVFTNAVLGFGLIALSVAILVIIQSVLKLPGVTS